MAKLDLTGSSIFGIDSSSHCTGWCEIGIEPLRLLRYGKIKVMPKNPNAKKEELFGDRYEAYSLEIYNQLLASFRNCQLKPFATAIEETAVVKGNQTAKMLIGLYQFIRIMLTKDTGVPVNVVNASHAKCVYTGNGKASKQECVEFTNKTFGTKFVFVDKAKDKEGISDEDVCDAIQTAVSFVKDGLDS